MLYLQSTPAFIFYLICLLHFGSCISISGLNISESLLTRLKRQAEPAPDALPGNANKFVDDLFNDNQGLFVERGLDPFQIGKIEICSDCVLSGLSTIRRTGDATIKQETNGDIIVDINIGFGLLRGSCHCVKKLLLVSLSGVVRAVMRDLNIHATVRVNITPDASIKPSVDELEIIDPGKLDLYWEGRGILGNIVEPFFNLFRVKIASTVQRLLPSVLKTAVTQNIHRVTEFIRF